MSKTNRFNASDRLYILILITAASLIGLGMYGINDLKDMNNDTRSLYADRVVCMQQLSNVRFEYSAGIPGIAQDVKNGVITFSDAETRLRSAEKIINVNWADYKLTYLTPKEAQYIKETDVVKILADKADDDLEVVLIREDAAALSKQLAKNIFATYSPIVRKLTRLLDLQVLVAKEVSNHNDELYHQATQKFTLLIFFSLLVALSLSFFIIKNIKELINQTQKNSDIIKESEQKYRSLLGHASDAIYLLDAGNNFIEVNESMCKMTGYAHEELLLLKVEDIIDPEQLKNMPVFHWEQLPYQPLVREHRFVGKDGNVFDVEVNMRKFADNKVLVIAHDITEKKLTHEIILREKALSETLIKSLPGVFYLRNETGKLLLWNRNLETVTGYTRAEMGLVVRDMIAGEDHKILDETVEKAVNDGYAMAEAKLIIKNGLKIPFLITGCPIVYEGQTCLLGTGINISPHVEAREELRFSEANLQTILSTTDTAFALFDLKFKVLAFNQTADKFFLRHYNHALQKGEQLKGYFSEQRVPGLADYVAAVLDGKNINYEMDYPHQNGSKLWYDVKLFPITNNEEILGLMVALYDITERKNAEQDLKNAYNHIQNHVESIKDMAWKQSHLIRSPLANLIGLVELLVADPADGGILEFIRTELYRMDSIIIEMASDVSDQGINNY